MVDSISKTKQSEVEEDVSWFWQRHKHDFSKQLLQRQQSVSYLIYHYQLTKTVKHGKYKHSWPVSLSMNMFRNHVHGPGARIRFCLLSYCTTIYILSSKWAGFWAESFEAHVVVYNDWKTFSGEAGAVSRQRWTVLADGNIYQLWTTNCLSLS